MTDHELIEDVLRPGLRAVFCGTALGAASARAGAYYAGPRNKFWPTLYAVGLTPRRLAPADYRDVLDYGLGLTDICKVQSGSDLEIGTGSFDVDRLSGQIEEFRPGWIAFNGKRAAKEAFGVSSVDYGPREDGFAGARAYVLPSTSGAASGHWDAAHWQRLAEIASDPS